MIRPREDRWFLRYRRTGDPRLLAKVFDRTADELYAVAAHLCRDRSDAEDAVQTTFLVAIEDRERWDDSRPLLPWLLGVLANRVRAQRRDRGRLDPARALRDDVEPDAIARAADAEFANACHAAVQRVPEPYRATLERNLLHGHSPTQIANELGIAAGTVRMRLSRGLDELRRRLPAGFAGGAAVALALAPAARAAMRARVLQSGSGVEGAAVGSSVGFLTSIGVLLMKKSVVSLLLLAVLAFGSYAALAPSSQDALASVPPAVVVSTTTRPLAEVQRSEPLAAEVRRQAPATVSRSETGSLRVVLRHSETKEPVAFVMLEAVCRKPVVSDAANRLAYGRTDDHGIAVLSVAAGEVTVATQILHLQAPIAAEVRAGHETEVVVELPVRFVAKVLVVDEDRAPVPGARIVGRTFADVGDLVERELGRTDRDGRFAMGFLDSGAPLRALADGFAASRPIDLHPREPEATLVLTRGAATLTGTVLDANGRALPGLTVALQPWRANEAGQRPLAVVTDERGVYRSAHVPPGEVRAFALRREQDVVATAVADATCSRGTETRLDLRFGLGARLTVAVTDANGEPARALPLAAVFWPQRELWSHLAIYTHATTDDSGLAVFEDLLPGTHEVQLHGKATKSQKVELAAGAHERIDWSLAPPTFVEVLVQDDAGAPLRDWVVSLLPERGTIAQARTDELGLVRFADVPEASYRVEVGEPSAATSVEANVQCGERNVVRVERAQRATASIHGRVTGTDVELVRHARVEISTVDSAFGAAVDAKGAFRLPRLVAGRYEFAVRHDETKGFLAQPRAIELVAEQDLDLGTIELALPSSVTFVVRAADGGDVRGACSAIQLPGGANAFHVGQDPLRWREVPHGRYTAVVFAEDAAPVVVPFVAGGGAVEVPVVLQRSPSIQVSFGPSAQHSGELVIRRNGADVLRLRLRDRAPRTIGLAAGAYDAEFTAGGEATTRSSFRVAVGETTRVDLAPAK